MAGVGAEVARAGVESDEDVDEIDTTHRIHLGIVKGAKGIRHTDDNLYFVVDAIHNIKGVSRRNAARDLRDLVAGI